MSTLECFWAGTTKLFKQQIHYVRLAYGRTIGANIFLINGIWLQLEPTPDEMIDQLVKNNSVAVFAKSYCPHSKKVKAFFKDQNIEFKFLDLDTLGEQGKAIQDRLKETTGQSTVPNVWVNQKFIGINFDLLKLRLTGNKH